MRVCQRVRKEKLLPVGAGVNKRFLYDGMVNINIIRTLYSELRKTREAGTECRACY